MAGIFRFDAAASLSRVPDAADQLRCIADALDQAGDAPPTFVHADGEDFDPVVVHERCGVDAGENQRCRPVIRQHQDIAIGAAAHPACDAFALARRRKTVRALDGLTVAHHCRQAFAQRITLRIRRHSQPLGETRCA